MSKLGKVGFKYQPKSIDFIRSKATRYGDSNKDSMIKGEYPIFTPEQGTNKIRLLPTGDYWGIPVYLHWIDVDGNGRPYLCPKKMANKRCAVCDEWRKAKADNDADYAKQLSYSIKLLVWMIDRAKEADGPKLYMIPSGMEQNINGTAVDEETQEVLALDNPDEGYDIRFNKEGKGITTKYTAVLPARKATALSDDPEQKEAWLNYIMEHPLEKTLNVMDSDYLESVFRGENANAPLAEAQEESDPAPEAEEEEEPEVVVTQPAARKTLTQKPAPKVEAPAETEEEEAPFEEEAPVRKAPAPAARPTAGSLRDRLMNRHK